MSRFNIWGTDYPDVLKEMQEGDDLLASLTTPEKIDFSNYNFFDDDISEVNLVELDLQDTKPAESIPQIQDTSDISPSFEKIDFSNYNFFDEMPPVVPKVVRGRGTIRGLPIVSGNIDVSKIQPVKNKDGSISTDSTISINEDGLTVLIPTVIDGKVMDTETAIQHYLDTGQHLGKFETIEDADIFVKNLHKNIASKYRNEDIPSPRSGSLKKSEKIDFSNYNFFDDIPQTDTPFLLKSFGSFHENKDFLEALDKANVDISTIIDSRREQKLKEKKEEFETTTQQLTNVMAKQGIALDYNNPEQLRMIGKSIGMQMVAQYKNSTDPKEVELGMQLEQFLDFFDSALYVNEETYDIELLPIALIKGMVAEGKQDMSRIMFNLFNNDRLYNNVIGQMTNENAKGYLESSRHMFKELQKKERWTSRDYNEFVRSFMTEAIITTVINSLPAVFPGVGMLVSLGLNTGYSLWQSKETQRAMTDGMEYLQTMSNDKRKTIVETGYRPEFVDDNGNVLIDKVTQAVMEYVNSVSPHKQSAINIENKIAKFDRAAIYDGTLLSVLSGELLSAPEYGIVYTPASFAGDVSANTLVQLMTLAANAKNLGNMAFSEGLKRLFAMEINENIRNVVLGKSAEWFMNDMGMKEMIDGSAVRNFNVGGINVPSLTASLVGGAFGQKIIGGAIYGSIDYTQKALSRKIVVESLNDVGFISEILSKHPHMKKFLNNSVNFLDLVYKAGDMETTPSMLNKNIFKFNTLIPGKRIEPTEEKLHSFVRNYGKIFGVDIDDEAITPVLKSVLQDKTGKVNQAKLTKLYEEIREITSDNTRPLSVKIDSVTDEGTVLKVVDIVPLNDGSVLRELAQSVLSGAKKQPWEMSLEEGGKIYSPLPEKVMGEQSGIDQLVLTPSHKLFLADAFAPTNLKVLMESNKQVVEEADKISIKAKHKITPEEVEFINELSRLSTKAAHSEPLNIDEVSAFVLKMFGSDVTAKQFNASTLAVVEELVSKFALMSSVRGKLAVQDTPEAKHMEAFNVASTIYGFMDALNSLKVDNKNKGTVSSRLSNILDQIISEVNSRRLLNLPEIKEEPLDPSRYFNYFERMGLEGKTVADLFREAGISIPDFKTAQKYSNEFSNVGVELFKTLIFTFAYNKNLILPTDDVKSPEIFNIWFNRILLLGDSEFDDFTGFVKSTLPSIIQFGRGAILDIFSNHLNNDFVSKETLKLFSVLEPFVKILVDDKASESVETKPLTLQEYQDAGLLPSEIKALQKNPDAEVNEKIRKGYVYIGEELVQVTKELIDNIKMKVNQEYKAKEKDIKALDKAFEKKDWKKVDKILGSEWSASHKNKRKSSAYKVLDDKYTSDKLLNRVESIFNRTSDSIISIEELRSKLIGSEITPFEALLRKITTDEESGTINITAPLKPLFESLVDIKKQVNYINDTVVENIKQYGFHGVTTEQIAMIGKVAVDRMFQGHSDGFGLFLVFGAMHHGSKGLLDAHTQWAVSESFKGLPTFLSRLSDFSVPDSMVKFVMDKYGVDIRNTDFIDGFVTLLGYNPKVFEKIFVSGGKKNKVFSEAYRVLNILKNPSKADRKYFITDKKLFLDTEEQTLSRVQSEAYKGIHSLLSVLLSSSEASKPQTKATKIIRELIGTRAKKQLDGMSEKVIEKLDVKMLYSELINVLRDSIRESIMESLSSNPKVKKLFIDDLKLTETMFEDVLSPKNIESYIKRMFAQYTFKESTLENILPQVGKNIHTFYDKIIDLKTKQVIHALSSVLSQGELDRVKQVGSVEWKDAMQRFYGYTPKLSTEFTDVSKIKSAIESEVKALFDRSAANASIDFLGIFKQQETPTREVTMDIIENEMSLLKLNSFMPVALKFLSYTDNVNSKGHTIPELILKIKQDVSGKTRERTLIHLKEKLLAYKEDIIITTNALNEIFGADVLKYYQESELKIIDNMLTNVNKILNSKDGLARFTQMSGTSIDSWVTHMYLYFEHQGVGVLRGLIKNMLSTLTSDTSAMTRGSVIEATAKTYNDMVSNSVILEGQKHKYMLDKLTNSTFTKDNSWVQQMKTQFMLTLSKVQGSDMVKGFMHLVATPLFAMSPEFKELNRKSKLFVEIYNTQLHMARSYIIDNPEKSTAELRSVFKSLLDMPEKEALGHIINSYNVQYPSVFKPNKTDSEQRFADAAIRKSKEQAKDFLTLLRAIDSVGVLDKFTGYIFTSFASKELSLDTSEETFRHIDGLLYEMVSIPKVQEALLKYMGRKFDLSKTKVETIDETGKSIKVNILKEAGINIDDAKVRIGAIGDDIVGSLMQGALTDTNVLKIFQAVAPNWAMSIAQIKTTMASLTHYGIIEGLFGVKEILDNPRYVPLIYSARGYSGLQKLRGNNVSTGRILYSISNHYISSKSKLFFNLMPEIKEWYDNTKQIVDEALKSNPSKVINVSFINKLKSQLVTILTKGLTSNIPFSVRLFARHLLATGLGGTFDKIDIDNFKEFGVTVEDLKTLPFFSAPFLHKMTNDIFEDVYGTMVGSVSSTKLSRLLSTPAGDVDSDALVDIIFTKFPEIQRWYKMMDKFMGTGKGQIQSGIILEDLWRKQIPLEDTKPSAFDILNGLFDYADFKDKDFQELMHTYPNFKVPGAASEEKTVIMTATDKALAERTNLDPSFRDILWPISNPIDAALFSVQRVVNSIRNKRYVADLLQSTNAVHMVYDDDPITKKQLFSNLSELEYREVTLSALISGQYGDFGVQLGKNLLASAEFTQKVESKAWDLTSKAYEEASTKSGIDMNKMDALERLFFEDEFQSKITESKALAYQEALDASLTTKVYINKNLWDEIQTMSMRRISKKGVTTDQKTADDVIKVVEDAFSDLRYYYSGSVLMLNNVSWQRNIIGALLTPLYALSLPAFVKYVPLAIKTLKSSGTEGAVEYHAHYRVGAPMVPMMIARFGAGAEIGRSHALRAGAGETGVVKHAVSLLTLPLRVMVNTSFKGLSKTLNFVAPEASAKLLGLDTVNEFTLNARMRTLYGMVDEITKFSIYMAARDGAIKTPEYIRNPALRALAKKGAQNNPKILSEIKRLESYEYYPKMSHEEALRFAEKFSFTYYELPKAWRVARSVVNPFISFVYNAGKITGNALLNYPMRTALLMGMLGQINDQMEKRWGIGLNLDNIIPGLDWMDKLKDMMTSFSGANERPYRAESLFNAPIGKFAYIMATGRDPFTNQISYYPNDWAKRLLTAGIQSFAPVPPTPDLAVRSLLYTIDRISGSSQYYDMMNMYLDKLLPESWLSKKVLEQGIRQQVVDSYGTRISPILSMIYATTGLNITIQDQIKMNTMLDMKMYKLNQNIERLKELKSLNQVDTTLNLPKEITNLEKENDKLKNDIVYYMRKSGLMIPSWLSQSSNELFGIRLMRFLTEYYLSIFGFETPKGVAPRSIGRQ